MTTSIETISTSTTVTTATNRTVTNTTTTVETIVTEATNSYTIETIPTEDLHATWTEISIRRDYDLAVNVRNLQAEKLERIISEGKAQSRIDRTTRNLAKYEAEVEAKAIILVNYMNNK